MWADCSYPEWVKEANWSVQLFPIPAFFFFFFKFCFQPTAFIYLPQQGIDQLLKLSFSLLDTLCIYCRSEGEYGPALEMQLV